MIEVFCTHNYPNKHLLPNYTLCDQPTRRIGAEISWNKFLVSHGSPLFTGYQEPCLAVFARATNPDNKELFVGGTHVFPRIYWGENGYSMSREGIEAAQSMLKELGDKTNQAAIEVFITGGNALRSSIEIHRALLSAIAEQNIGRANPITIVQDLCTNASDQLEKWDPKTGNYYVIDVRVSETGISSMGIPYVFYEAKIRGEKGSYPGPVEDLMDPPTR